MKTRVLSGIVLTVLLAAAVVFSGVPFVMNTLFGLIAAAGVWEMMRVSGLSAHRGMTAFSVAFAGLFVFFSDPWICADYRTALTCATFVFILVVLVFGMKHNDTVTPSNAVFLSAITLMVAYFFSTAVLLRHANETGLWHLILIFVLSWLPDTGAYFTGYFFGKHKLSPVISPKKTIEGAVGGLLTGILATVLWGLAVGHFSPELSINWRILPVYAVGGVIVSILGDLTASYIKRHYGVKDYSDLIPGHGGIMDRFDSVWFVSPFVFLLWQVCPLFLPSV